MIRALLPPATVLWPSMECTVTATTSPSMRWNVALPERC